MFLIDQDEINELIEIARQLRPEKPELAEKLERIAEDTNSRRVMDDTCW